MTTENQGTESASPTEKLHAAIAAASLAFEHPAKSAPGQYRQSRFKYAPLRAIVDAVRKPLAEHGVSLLQLLSSDGEKAKLTLIIAGFGTSLTSEMVFTHPSVAQEFGSVSTYMRRYQLQSAFCLEGDPDLDEVDDTPRDSNRPTAGVDPFAVKQQLAAAAAKPSTVDAIAARVAELGYSAVRMRDLILEHKAELGGKERLSLMSESERVQLLAILASCSDAAP